MQVALVLSASFVGLQTPVRRCGALRAQAPLMASKLNLIYDGKCSVCQWEMNNLISLGAEGKITFTDLEDDCTSMQ